MINLLFGWLGGVLGGVCDFSELKQASNDGGNPSASSADPENNKNGRKQQMQAQNNLTGCKHVSVDATDTENNKSARSADRHVERCKN